ncbi:hypothetical protein HAX54_010493 [Datura stramonium]|uniref:Uncharacterized protein n=1 Tax=Datura stramonium TaxID=4076 RepID=A0ABS8TI97_DATST|nr:hypothetical protein [Datura stramonium]
MKGRGAGDINGGLVLAKRIKRRQRREEVEGVQCGGTSCWSSGRGGKGQQRLGFSGTMIGVSWWSHRSRREKRRNGGRSRLVVCVVVTEGKKVETEIRVNGFVEKRGERRGRSGEVPDDRGLPEKMKRVKLHDRFKKGADEDAENGSDKAFD